MLQRAGRLHRHQRTRPDSCSTARLFVAGLHQDGFPDLKGTKWEYVYDRFILARSWAFLKRETVLEMPGAIDRLVQIVYGDEPLPDDVPADVRDNIETTALGEHIGDEQTKSQQAINAAIDPFDEPQSAYTQKPGSRDSEGLDIDSRTRLGDESITVIPIYEDADGWRIRPDEPGFDPQSTIDDALAKRLYLRQFRLSHKAALTALAAMPTPKTFDEHPLLRHYKPLVLTEGRTQLGSVRLRLDHELGLMVDREHDS